MKRTYLHTVVFFSGLGVMAVEITASRLLAPHFGASLVVWSGLIGVVLVALSVGYPLGGWLADKLLEKGFTGLCLAVWAAGLFILISPALLAATVSWGAVSFLILGIPVCLLAMVLPMAGKTIISSPRKIGGDGTGRGLGGLLLSSTLGSVLGTFLPVWVTIPWLGSRETFFLCGSILCLLAVIGFLQNKLLSIFLFGVALAVALFSIRFSQPPRDADVIYEGESAYHFIRVVQEKDRSRLLMVNEGSGMQSYLHPDRQLTGFYWDVAALLPVLNRSGESFLFLGLGGGTSARVVHHYFPSIRLEGVEIDPMVIKIGNDFFGLDQVPIRTDAMDARVFLRSAGERYDFVMIDVYKDNRTIPFHLATREFFEEVKGHLNRRGAILMNVSNPPTGRRLTEVIENTVASVFPHVYKLAWVGRAELILAFLEPPSFNVSTKIIPPDLTRLVTSGISRLIRVEFRPDGEVSTDNRSPVEVLAAGL